MLFIVFSKTRELTFALVGICIAEAWGLSGLASDQTPEVRAHLVLATVLYGVALSTLLDKNLLSLLDVSHNQLEKQEEQGRRDRESRESQKCN